MKRSFLTGLGITDSEVIKQIIDFHQGVMQDVKEDVATARNDLKTAQSELKTANATIVTLQKADPKNDGEGWEAKYNTLKGEFDTLKTAKEKEISDLKTSYETEKNTAAKMSKLEQKLLDAGANSKYVKKIAKDIDIATLIDDGDGFKDWEKTLEAVKPSWSEMFGAEKTRGVRVDNPPARMNDNTSSGNSNATMNDFIRGIKG